MEDEGGAPGSRKSSAALSMPSLKEGDEEAAEEEEEEGRMALSRTAPASSSSSGATPSSSSSSGPAPDAPPKYTFQQLSILTSVCEGILVHQTFKDLVNYAAEQQAAIM